MLPDRAQPPPEPMRLDHRRLATGSPARPRAQPAEVRDHRAGAPGQRLQHLLARQEPQRPGGGHLGRRQPSEWPLSKGLRPLLRLPRRRDQQVVSRPASRTTTTIEPALHARRGLPPVEGPGRPGDLGCCATSSRRRRPSPGSCGSARARTTRPHHAPQEYIDKYKGKFDDGYEAYREWVLPRMIETRRSCPRAPS